MLNKFVEFCCKNQALRKRLLRVLGRDYLNEQKAHILEQLRSEPDPQFLGQAARALGGEISYSQEGEDILLTGKLMHPSPPGFFADIGAHHPTRFSNTFLLYSHGWRGINIDATPGAMAEFSRLRPEDINIECAVSDKNTPLQFHIFKEPALNTFDARRAQTLIAAGWDLAEVKIITPRPLAEILDAHVPPGTAIRLMNIDVEGEEMGVLASNNWDKYMPEWIILEIRDTPVREIFQTPEMIFMMEKGYELVSRLQQSVILRRNDG